MLNALGENEDQKYQTKLLESLLTKWLVNQDITGQNESIFGITLLSQYDLVSISLTPTGQNGPGYPPFNTKKWTEKHVLFWTIG